ncbi:MAG: alpha/beta hydrolase [Steroidobacteraceae bacterium]|jgi:pimeloyl-ACP methyl ester carboxylesterase|nr:alpha/beta hydrolase [Steroidobacteraceae bacterium]
MKRVVGALLGLVVMTWLGLTAWAYWPGEAEVPVARLASADDRFLAVDGLRLRYRAWGAAGEGRPDLLLIHGFANSLQSWRLLAPRLADCCHVVAIDMPGYGLSDKPVDFDYHNGPQAAVMVAAARALGLRRTIYVGHSLGGAIALQAVVRDPDAAGLVLLNPGILTTGVPKIVQVTLPPLPRMSAKLFGSREFRGNFLRTSYVDPSIVTPQVIDDLMLGARAEGYMAGMTSLMKQYAEGEEIALAARVRVPTLIPWGDQDRNKLRSEADDLQRLIPGSELVRFADAGHYVHEEAAAGVARAIEAWLPRTAAAGTAPGAPPDALPGATEAAAPTPASAAAPITQGAAS